MTGFFGIGQFLDELGHVVFQKFLAVGLEARDHRAAVGGIGAGQSEVQRFAARVAGGSDCSPASAAWSSSSENGWGSITCRRILPPERAVISSRNSRTRVAYGMISGDCLPAASREK